MSNKNTGRQAQPCGQHENVKDAPELWLPSDSLPVAVEPDTYLDIETSWWRRLLGHLTLKPTRFDLRVERPNPNAGRPTGVYFMYDGICYEISADSPSGEIPDDAAVICTDPFLYTDTTAEAA